MDQASHTPLKQTTDKSEPFIVRKMRDEDIEQVHQIDLLSFSIPWPARSYKYELHENPNSICWVAETVQSSLLPPTALSRQRIVGIIVIWMILDEVHIATIAVHPDYRRHGVAQALLVTALKAAAKLGAQQATLEVRSSNQAAQRLYQKFNFEIVGVRPRYYRDNDEDALIMTSDDLDRSKHNPGQQYPVLSRPDMSDDDLSNRGGIL